MLLILLFLFITTTLSAKAPVCTSVLFSAKWSKCDGLLLYSADIQMNVTVDSKNHTFPNIVTLSKISEYSANYGYFFADTPITYSYIRYWNDGYRYGMPYFLWNSTDTPYSFHYPNGEGQFDIAFNDGSDIVIYGIGFFATNIHNGELFMNFFPLASPCIQDDYDPSECGFWEVYSNQSICCNNFVYVDVPDHENEICELYQSTTTLKDSSQSIIAYLNASYIIGNNEIILNVTDFKSYTLSPGSRYAIGSNLQCTGNNGSPYSTCSFYLWDKGDIRYNFFIDYEWIDQNQTLYGYYPIAAIFVRRNGIFLKDDNTLFTSKNPCWKLSTEIAYGNETHFDTSLCCKSFIAAPSSTTPKSTTSSTTKPVQSCLKFSTMTSISGNSGGLKAFYHLNSTGMEVNITSYTGPDDSSAQIEVYSPDSFLLPCKKTFGSPFKPCFYALSDNKNYELRMRTSIFKDGFNMVSIVVENGKLILPVLPTDFPCYVETNPYNNANSNLTATTAVCCDVFG